MLTPFVQIPSLNISGPVGIHPFGVLVATGILAGAALTVRRGVKLGLADEMIRSMIFWSVGIGFIGAHIADVFLYQTGDFEKKLLEMFHPFSWFSSFSSMGGFAGAVFGLWLWCKKNNQEILGYADSLAYGLALGWMFGRLGCFVAHDHPGNLTQFPLGVDYPCNPADWHLNKWWINTDATCRRHDLGLYEALVAGALSAFYLIAERFRPRKGFYVAAIALYYGPVRFFLDYMRADTANGGDVRYLGLTPAQYAAILVTLAGVLLTVRVARRRPVEYPSS